MSIKATETSGVCSNSFQVSFKVVAGVSQGKKVNLIEKAKMINTVDALSFREMGDLEFL